jgi:hypothetical protein
MAFPLFGFCNAIVEEGVSQCPSRSRLVDRPARSPQVQETPEKMTA